VSDGECRPVQVSRRIAAPADMIFRILSDPGRHPDIDGSGTLRDASAGAGVPGAGRWRRWSYELTPDGAQATTVTEIYDCCRGPEDAGAGLGNGTIMIEAMTRTLERLAALCAR